MKSIRTFGPSLIAAPMIAASSTMLTSSALAQGYHEFVQVAHVADIRQARGLVFGANVQSSDPVGTTYYVSGEWVLNCRARCETAQLANIMFDLSHSMITTDGTTSRHAHQYSNFRATSVTVTPDDDAGVRDNSKLTIVGTITLHLSGSDRSVGITVELFRPTKTGIFTFALTGTTHIESTIGGVIVESER